MHPTVRLALITLAGAALAAAAGPVPAARAATGSIAAIDARPAIETWVRRVTADARSDAVIARMEPWPSEGEAVAWIAELEGGGFCLAGAHDYMLPVYYYSPAGTYDPAHPGLRFLLEGLRDRQAAAAAALEGLAAPELNALRATRQADWATLRTGVEPKRPPRPALEAMPASLVLPATCLWDQGSPYNDQLPQPDPARDRVLTGCNATATAQIMYYWKWPATGTGVVAVNYTYRQRANWDPEPLQVASAPGIPPLFSGRLRYRPAQNSLEMNGIWDTSWLWAAQGLSTNSEYQSALSALWNRLSVVSTSPVSDLGLMHFDWSLMTDSPADPVDPGDQEVAELMRGVTLACDTFLGMLTSNSFFGNDVDALEQNFFYDADAVHTDAPSNGGPGADIGSLTEEVLWGRPCGLGGSNPQGAGHAWVVNGYSTGTDPNRQFWMNYGWSGSQNGWYSLDQGPFAVEHDMMTRIAPVNVKFVKEGGSGDGSPSAPYGTVGEAIAEAPAGSTLMFKAGTSHAFTGTINKPLRLNGYGAVIH